MNVYEVDIWRSVTHNGKFSHNATRQQLVHALNEERARGKVLLAKAKDWESGMKIEASEEVIYSIKKTGTVTKQMFYVYSDGRSPRPIMRVATGGYATNL